MSSQKPKYLYGAAVQGIQGFIFKTNKLKDIVGASELVERICTDQFNDLIIAHLKQNGKFNTLVSKLPKEKNIKKKNELIAELTKKTGEPITQAAGNVKFLFSDKPTCEHVVKKFPKQIMEYAPGITISQAVVEFKGDLTMVHLNLLEQKLKTQRNKATVDIEKGLLITERSRNTGMPAVKKESEEFLDKAVIKKRNAVQMYYGNKKENESSRGTLAYKFLNTKIYNHFNKKKGDYIQFEYNTDKLTKNEEKSYIAVIHADGNNLGKIIQLLGKQLESTPDKIQEAYTNFSKAIDRATIEAAQFAFYETFEKEINKVSGKIDIPFRPIVLSGDDLTVICEAKYAMIFTKAFLDKFEVTSKEQISQHLNGFELDLKKLTACAGIAYIKNKFPFYYAADLAEALCGEAKKVSKSKIKDGEDVPSSVQFFKVESTFFNSYSEIKERALMATKTKIDFCFGPYFTGDSSSNQEPKLQKLIDQTTVLREQGAPASHLRKWLNVVHKDIIEANHLMDRTIQILDLNKTNDSISFKKQLDLKKFTDSEIEISKSDNRETIPTHIYDMVSLASLTKTLEDKI